MTHSHQMPGRGRFTRGQQITGCLRGRGACGGAGASFLGCWKSSGRNMGTAAQLQGWARSRPPPTLRHAKHISKLIPGKGKTALRGVHRLRPLDEPASVSPPPHPLGPSAGAQGNHTSAEGAPGLQPGGHGGRGLFTFEAWVSKTAKHHGGDETETSSEAWASHRSASQPAPRQDSLCR